MPTDQLSEPVQWREHRGKPLTPPSPPVSGSPSNSGSPSSDSSPSSRARSPRGEKAKDKVKSKDKETRVRPSPFSAEIASTKIPKSLEKPPPLTMYTGRGNPDEHVDTFDLILDYRDASDNVQCKLFPLSKSALKRYRELPLASISSWSQFTKLFSTRFTASRVKPKSADVLQGEKEILWEYLERYNQVADDLHQLSDEIQVLFMRHSLRKWTLFH